MTRRAVVAGHFYPARAGELSALLQRLAPPAAGQRRALGLLAPHAGYVYSGACAGMAYARLALPPTVIVLGVNHRGAGAEFAVDGHDAWETPLGDVAVDAELRRSLLAGTAVFRQDNEASRLEHSLEVQLPFIRHARPDARILPITVAGESLDRLQAAADEIARMLAGRSDLMLVASSDMSHYIPAARARELDLQAIACMERLDAEGLYRTVRGLRISMCGVAPAVIMLRAARAAGAGSGELVCYANSGDVSGDQNEVVGYASLIVS